MYVRSRVNGTLGWFDRAVLRNQRLFIADNPADDPPDRLCQVLVGLGLVEIDPDQSAPAPPAPVRVSILGRLRARWHDWQARRERARVPAVTPASFEQAATAALIGGVRPGLILPNGRPVSSLRVMECGCATTDLCPHVRA